MPENAVAIGDKERDEEIRACNEEQAELENEIYALKVEVETLGEENNALSNDNINLEMNLQSLAEENERLKAKNAKYLNAIEDFTAKKCCLKYDIAKILVKEFAEELKEKFKENEDCFFDLEKEIDELLKEYEE